jgi:hypothetical protein
MICRKNIDPTRPDQETQTANNNANNNEQAIGGLEELPDLIQNGVLEIIEDNIIQGNDPFEVGRRVQYEMQRLNNTDRQMEEIHMQDESLISQITTMEDNSSDTASHNQIHIIVNTQSDDEPDDSLNN